MADFQPIWLPSTSSEAESFLTLDTDGNNPDLGGFEPIGLGAAEAFAQPLSSQDAAEMSGPEGTESSASAEAGGEGGDALKEVRDEYFEAGRQEGIEAGRLEIAHEVERILTLGAQFDQLRQEVFSRSVRDVAQAVIHISRQIVRRELAVNSDGVEELVMSALDHVRSKDELVIRLSPADHARLGDLAPKLFDRLGRDASFRVESSPDLEPGGTIVQTDYGRIDASIEAQIAAFAENIDAWAIEEVGVLDD